MSPGSDAGMDMLLLFSEPLFFVQNGDDATCFTKASKMLSTYGRGRRKGYPELINQTLSHLHIFPYRALTMAILAWTPLNS